MSTDVLADLQGAVGTRHTSEDVLTASQVGRLAATLDVEHPAPSEGDPLPPGWHAAFFPQLAPGSRLRSDGQPRGGGLLPEVPLPRRLLAGVRSWYHDELRVGDAATRVSEVAAVEAGEGDALEASAVEPGEAGAPPRVRITVRESISTERGLAVVDERDVLFFGEGGPGSSEAQPSIPEGAQWKRAYTSDPVTIFRLSALRFNAHRIHYDRRYATEQEGYPGIVVPVSLVSLQMLALVRAELPDRQVSSFAYRSHHPMFEPGSYTVAGALGGEEATLWATDDRGSLAMLARAALGPAGTSTTPATP